MKQYIKNIEAKVLIDYNKLENLITEWINDKGCWRPYIFVSLDTFNDMKTDAENGRDGFYIRNNAYHTWMEVASYLIYPVYIDNNLKRGEVSLR